jgi:GDSL-like Lipase/Acylhydrolase
MTNKSLWITRLLLAVSSFVFTVLGLELFLRIFPPTDFQTNDPYQYIKYISHSDDDERYRWKKHLFPLQFDERGYYSKSSGLIFYNFNQFGARWLEAGPQNTAGTGVIVLGDSFTYGFGLRYQDTYIYKLQNRLYNKGVQINFWNFARPGADSKECLKIYHKRANGIQHEMILYGLDLNDLIKFDASYVINKQVSGKWVTLQSKSKLLEFIINKKNRYVDKKRKLRELTSPEAFQHQFFRANFQAIIQLKEEALRARKSLRVIVLPVLVDLKRDSFRPAFDYIMAALKQQGIKYYDLTSFLRNYKDTDLWVLPFDQHPNEKANELFANQLSDLFLAEIDEILPRFTANTDDHSSSP